MLWEDLTYTSRYFVSHINCLRMLNFKKSGLLIMPQFKRKTKFKQFFKWNKREQEKHFLKKKVVQLIMAQVKFNLNKNIIYSQFFRISLCDGCICIHMHT